MPTIFGFGGGKYLWAKYPANKTANIDEPTIAKQKNCIYLS